jgi:hypothetical protein
VDYSQKKKTAPQAMPEAERRRIGQVAHDERGNAFVSWRDAPADHERPVLEILGEGSLGSSKHDISYDPYARTRAARESAPLRKPSGGTTRTDLRRLSEHIKLMRALEERKRNGEDDED